MLRLITLLLFIDRLFIGNFQVPLLKKWIENDTTDENEETAQKEVLPRESSSGSMSFSTMRRRGN
jgi:hypothetical protein